MVKVSKTKHVRRTGRGKGKLRNNPKKKTKGRAPWVKGPDGLFVGRDDDGKSPYPPGTITVGDDTTGNIRFTKTGRIDGRTEGTTKKIWDAKPTKTKYVFKHPEQLKKKKKK